MRVMIEKAGENYSAYVPDLPGCVATGDTLEEVEAEIRAAVRFHIDGLREEALDVPEPTASLNTSRPRAEHDPRAIGCPGARMMKFKAAPRQRGRAQD
jgi:predicted RNase H-like HicB family nuclease